MFIVATALGVNLLLINQMMHARVQNSVAAELKHEVVKFRDYSQRVTDPNTTESYSSVRMLMRGYLTEAVPEANEALFTVIDGRAVDRTPGHDDARLDRRAEVLTAVNKTEEPLTRQVKTTEGVAVYAVVPVEVEAGQPRAALVIVQYTGAAQAEVRQLVQVTAIASVLALLIAAGISWFVAGRILDPLRKVRRTAEKISETDLTRRIEILPDAQDDVTRLAVTFNGMLDRLQAAFGTQRAFLDDAAHELRTPLTVLRGHLELMGDDPVERAATTELLLEEISRMNRIVDDLLDLASVDRPDFLNIDEVDLTDLVVGAVARASALASRKWTVTETADVIVLADEQRLIQALVQIASNAVRFTTETDTISIGSTVVGASVELTVTDSGDGVNDAFKEQIFDRFARDNVRGRDGAGLGLAIVRSIIASHCGTIRVSDTPGGGATFVLRFPVRLPEDRDPDHRLDIADHVPPLVPAGRQENR